MDLIFKCVLPENFHVDFDEKFRADQISPAGDQVHQAKLPPTNRANGVALQIMSDVICGSSFTRSFGNIFQQHFAPHLQSEDQVDVALVP